MTAPLGRSGVRAPGPEAHPSPIAATAWQVGLEPCPRTGCALRAPPTLSAECGSRVCLRTPYASCYVATVRTAYTAEPATPTAPSLPLRRERVLEAALVVAERVGLERLSMRLVAGQLGVSPMALYRHVANKDDLLDGLVT